MKKITTLLIATWVCITAWSQGRQTDIALMPAIETNDAAIEKYAKQTLLSKVSTEIATVGFSSVSVGRFILLMKIEPTEKQSSGELIQISYHADLSVEDLMMHTGYSHFGVDLFGSGHTEGQAIMDAARRLNLSKSNFTEHIKKGINEIVNYYNANCNKLLQNAQSYAEVGNFDEAYALLYQLPDGANLNCKQQCNSFLNSLLKQQAAAQCTHAVEEANKEWSLSPNAMGIGAVAEALQGIQVTKDCKPAYDALLNEIKKKNLKDELDEKQLQLKKYDNEYSLEKERIGAMREIALGYYKQVMPTVYLRL